MPEGVSEKEFKDGLTPRAAVEAKSKEELDRLGLESNAVYDEEGNITRSQRVRKPSRTSRSPLKGTTTTQETYEEWMLDQPNYYQDKVLGKTSAQRLRDGESLTAVLKDTRSSINFETLDEALN